MAETPFRLNLNLLQTIERFIAIGTGVTCKLSSSVGQDLSSFHPCQVLGGDFSHRSERYQGSTRKGIRTFRELQSECDPPPTGQGKFFLYAGSASLVRTEVLTMSKNPHAPYVLFRSETVVETTA